MHFRLYPFVENAVEGNLFGFGILDDQLFEWGDYELFTSFNAIIKYFDNLGFVHSPFCFFLIIWNFQHHIFAWVISKGILVRIDYFHGVLCDNAIC